jgi:hypothetical protein
LTDKDSWDRNHNTSPPASASASPAAIRMTNCTERSIGVSRFSAQRFLTPNQDIAFCLFRPAPHSVYIRPGALCERCIWSVDLVSALVYRCKAAPTKFQQPHPPRPRMASKSPNDTRQADTPSRAVRHKGGIRSEMSVFIRSERRCGPRVAGILFLKTVSPAIGCQRHGLLVKRDHGPLARRAFTARFGLFTTSWLHPKDG